MFSHAPLLRRRCFPRRAPLRRTAKKIIPEPKRTVKRRNPSKSWHPGRIMVYCTRLYFSYVTLQGRAPILGGFDMESTVFAGKTLLITGGTGSFGNTVLKHFLCHRHRRDPHLFPRRKKAGRHAPRLPAPISGAERQDQILYRRRAQSGQPARRDARRGLYFPRGRAQAGSQLRVLPHGGRAHQRAGHRQRTDSRHRRGREKGGLPLHRQGGLPHQCHGHLQGHDGKGYRREGAHRQGRSTPPSAAPATATSWPAAAA